MLTCTDTKRIGSKELNEEMKLLEEMHRVRIQEEVPEGEESDPEDRKPRMATSPMDIFKTIKVQENQQNSPSKNEDSIDSFGVEDERYRNNRPQMNQSQQLKTSASSGSKEKNALTQEENKELDSFLQMDDDLQKLIKKRDPDLYNRITKLKQRRNSGNRTDIEPIDKHAPPRRSNSGVFPDIPKPPKVSRYLSCCSE